MPIAVRMHWRACFLYNVAKEFHCEVVGQVGCFIPTLLVLDLWSLACISLSGGSPASSSDDVWVKHSEDPPQSFWEAYPRRTWLGHFGSLHLCCFPVDLELHFGFQSLKRSKQEEGEMCTPLLIFRSSLWKVRFLSCSFCFLGFSLWVFVRFNICLLCFYSVLNCPE